MNNSFGLYAGLATVGFIVVLTAFISWWAGPDRDKKNRDKEQA